MLVLIQEAARQGAPLSSPDLEALCYLLSVDGQSEELRFPYRYRFNPGPRSADFVESFAQLSRADLARAASPLQVEPAGEVWLRDRAGTELEQVRRQARAALERYRDIDLFNESVRMAQGIRKAEREEDAKRVAALVAELSPAEVAGAERPVAETPAPS